MSQRPDLNQRSPDQLRALATKLMASLVDTPRNALLERTVLHADETPVNMLAPGNKKTHRAYVWAYCTTPFSDLSGMIYKFAPILAGEHARTFPGDWQAKRVCDDYSGYKASFGNGITEIGCMAHAQRGDPNETKAATVAAIEHDGPTFVRVLRSPVNKLEGFGVKFQFGQSQSYGRGPDVLFITNGLALHRVIEAIPFLSQKDIESTVVNALSVRPLDSATVWRRAASCRVVVTVEEGNAQGVLGSAVSKLLAEHGGTDEIFAHLKLDAASICTSVVDFMERTFTGQRTILHCGLTR